MFGSNSPQYSEQALVHRVRLAHPDSQIQLSNSDFNSCVSYVALSDSLQLYLGLTLPSSRNASLSFALSETPSPAGSTSDGGGAYHYRARRACRVWVVVPTPLPPTLRHSRRVLIVHPFTGRFNPCDAQNAVDSNICSPRLLSASYKWPRSSLQPVSKAREPPCFKHNRRRTTHRMPKEIRPTLPSARHHGPCRNRTYNLAIKSRLLCQLS